MLEMDHPEPDLSLYKTYNDLPDELKRDYRPFANGYVQRSAFETYLVSKSSLRITGIYALTALGILESSPIESDPVKVANAPYEPRSMNNMPERIIADIRATNPYADEENERYNALQRELGRRKEFAITSF